MFDPYKTYVVSEEHYIHYLFDNKDDAIKYLDSLAEDIKKRHKVELLYNFVQRVAEESYETGYEDASQHDFIHQGQVV